ncbi:hypothetical protein V5R04_07250 [Jonesiaceae bacterium BS-20]|uniref:Uncharacterized protein n=1 Tax=Jonesiaceae bacterium BS-20 TaxID=3120821 RepID=A0AAU7DYA5_9MICO
MTVSGLAVTPDTEATEADEYAALEAQIAAEEAAKTSRPDEDPAELEEDDLEDEDLEDEDDDEPGTPSTKAAGTPSQRPLVRKAVAKAIALRDADQRSMQLLGAIYGVEPTIERIAVETVINARRPGRVIADIEAIAATSPFQASAAVQATVERRGAKWARTVHALLTILGAASTKSLTGSNTKAAGTLAQDIHELSDAAHKDLTNAVDLARK